MELVLDTNFIIYSVRFHLIEEIKELGYRLIVLDSVKNELDKLAERGNVEAALAIQLLGSLGAKITPTEVSNVDRSIIKFSRDEKARGEDVVVATMDRELTVKLKNEGIQTIIIKGEKKISKA